MIGGLFLSACANNIGLVGGYNNETKLVEGDVKAKGATGFGAPNADINLSRGFFRCKTAVSVIKFPRFHIFSVIGVGGGGGGGGTAGYTASDGDGEGGKAGVKFEFLGQLVDGTVDLARGLGGNSTVGYGENGKAGSGVFSSAFAINSAVVSSGLGGAGGRAWNGSGVYTRAGQVSLLSPAGNGGRGAGKVGPVVSEAGNNGSIDFRGIVW